MSARLRSGDQNQLLCRERVGEPHAIHPVASAMIAHLINSQEEAGAPEPALRAEQDAAE